MNLKAQLKYTFKKWIGHYSHLKQDVSIGKQWFGNNYGGFFVATEFLDSNSIVYSFGIGEDISFDTELIKKYSCKVFGFDPTPKSIDWIEEQSLPSKFTFYDFGLDTQSGIKTFYLPINQAHVSGSLVNQNNVSQNRAVEVKMKSIRDIFNSLNHRKIDILKMDIEGSEYDVIDNILKSGIEINQICVEFHDRFFPSPSKSIETIRQLRKAGFLIYGVSGSFEEVSLIHSRML